MSRVGSAGVPGRFGISFVILLVVQVMTHRDPLTSFPNKILTLDLQEGSESHGEWIGKLAKTTRMAKIKNSQERSKTGFPGPLVVICDDLGWLVTIPDG